MHPHPSLLYEQGFVLPMLNSGYHPSAANDRISQIVSMTFEETRSAHTVSLVRRCRISTDIYVEWQASETSLHVLASQPDIDHFIRLFHERISEINSLIFIVEQVHSH